MLPRTLEPEVMDTLEEAVDYDSMDHSTVNEAFAAEFLEALESSAEFGVRNAESATSSSEQIPHSALRTPHFPRVLDVGTGTAQIPIAICRKTGRLRITAVDLSANMLQLGQRNVIAAGFTRLIKLEHVDAKGLPYADGSFDAVISNSIVHHIPQPLTALREMRRVLRPGGLLFVRDLLRPPDVEQVTALVAQHAAGANAHQRQLFDQSLHAALTLEELRALLRDLGMPPEAAFQSSDRHWTIRSTAA